MYIFPVVINIGCFSTDKMMTRSMYLMANRQKMPVEECMVQIIVSITLSALSVRFLLLPNVASLLPRVSLFFKCNKKVLRRSMSAVLIVAHTVECVVERWMYNAALYRSIKFGQGDLVRHALSCGADPNRLDRNGRSPLHHAVWNEDLEALRTLIDYGADVNVLDKDENTPLHEAASRSLPLVKALIRNGANICVSNMEGKTPLQCATEAGMIKIVEYLIEVQKNQGKNQWRREEYRCLRAAIKMERIDLVKLFLSNGMEVNIRMYTQPFLYQSVELGRLDFVKLLIQYGADVNEPDSKFYFGGCSIDKNRHTPLELAIQKRRVDIVQVLIENGAQFSGSIAQAFKQNCSNNAKQLMENWKWLHIFGISEANIHSIIPEIRPIFQNTGTVEVVIQGKVVAYPSSLISHIPYFAFWAGKDRIDWKEAPSFDTSDGKRFVLDHETLGGLIKQLSNPNYLWEEDLTLFDPLSLGICPHLPFPVIPLRNILKIQAQLLDDHLVELGQFSDLTSLENIPDLGPLQGLFESSSLSPGVKDPSVDLESPMQVIKRQMRYFECFCSFVESLFSIDKGVNKIVSHFVQLLDKILIKQIETEGAASLECVKTLVTVFDEYPELAKNLTVLEVPYHIALTQPGLNDLLKMLPNVSSIYLKLGKKGAGLQEVLTFLHPKQTHLRLHYEVGNIEGAIDETVLVLNWLIKKMFKFHRIYYCNAIVFDFIQFLDTQRAKELEQNKQSKINQMEILTRV